jgi:hypothetical protein
VLTKFWVVGSVLAEGVVYDVLVLLEVGCARRVGGGGEAARLKD